MLPCLEAPFAPLFGKTFIFLDTTKVIFVEYPSKQTNKQTNKQTSKQTNKQTSKTLENKKERPIVLVAAKRRLQF
jgi:hypothetical protein